MKSITIHKLDDEVEQHLAGLAEREGLSLDELINKLLRDASGIDGAKEAGQANFEQFCGQWTQGEKDEFDEATAMFSEIDDEMWK